MAQTSRSNPAIGGAVPTQYDLMLALARKIVNGEEEEEGESVEEAFAQAREAEAVSEELLVDEGWHAVEVEPEVLVAHRNGTAVTVEIEAANGQEADDTDSMRFHSLRGGNEDDEDGHQVCFTTANASLIG